MTHQRAASSFVLNCLHQIPPLSAKPPPNSALLCLSLRAPLPCSTPLSSAPKANLRSPRRFLPSGHRIFPKMKRFAASRHYSCAPTTQGQDLKNHPWVEGAGGHTRAAVTNSGLCPHLFIDSRI